MNMQILAIICLILIIIILILNCIMWLMPYIKKLDDINKEKQKKKIAQQYEAEYRKKH